MACGGDLERVLGAFLSRNFRVRVAETIQRYG